HNKGDIFPQARACTLPEGTPPASITVLAQIPTLSASRKLLMHNGNATNLHGFSSLRPEINLVGASIEICR
ncbi:hypothetical protein, partial [Cupriavidus pauculus]|uniref:hypothetical protein n=1 Tax=Cupriavidus pauculus TaxID=82633 RepID=UPI001BA69716